MDEYIEPKVIQTGIVDSGQTVGSSRHRQNVIILLGIRTLANGTNANTAWVGLTCKNENKHSLTSHFAERQ